MPSPKGQTFPIVWGIEALEIEFPRDGAAEGVNGRIEQKNMKS
jgi:hypothetical protein